MMPAYRPALCSGSSFPATAPAPASTAAPCPAASTSSSRRRSPRRAGSIAAYRSWLASRVPLPAGAAPPRRAFLRGGARGARRARSNARCRRARARRPGRAAAQQADPADALGLHPSRRGRLVSARRGGAERPAGRLSPPVRPSARHRRPPARPDRRVPPAARAAGALRGRRGEHRHAHHPGLCRRTARLCGGDYHEVDAGGGHLWFLRAPALLAAELSG